MRISYHQYFGHGNQIKPNNRPLTMFAIALFLAGVKQEVCDEDIRRCSSIDHYSLMIAPKIALTGRTISRSHLPSDRAPSAAVMVVAYC